MKFIARLGPFHTYLELFENGHFFLRFRRNASPRVFAVVFARPHENAETMEISIESLTEHA